MNNIQINALFEYILNRAINLIIIYLFSSFIMAQQPMLLTAELPISYAKITSSGKLKGKTEPKQSEDSTSIFKETLLPIINALLYFDLPPKPQTIHKETTQLFDPKNKEILNSLIASNYFEFLKRQKKWNLDESTRDLIMSVPSCEPKQSYYRLRPVDMHKNFSTSVVMRSARVHLTSMP